MKQETRNLKSWHALLFDLDGTLIDSVEDIALAVNHVRQYFHLAALPVDRIRGYVGDGVHKLMERALETTDPSQIHEAIGLWRPFYDAHCVEKTRLYDGIQEWLDQLADRGIQLGVVTNKPLAPTRTILRKLDIDGRFQVVVGGDTLPQRKPDPEPLLHAVTALRQPCPNVLVVGDSPNDIHAARRAGYASCAVLWGFTPEQNLRQLNTDFILRHPSEGLNIIQEA